MGDTTKLRHLAFAVVFAVWAVYLIVKGMNVGDGSQTRDAAEASYYAGGAIVAALALLPLISQKS